MIDFASVFEVGWIDVLIIAFALYLVYRTFVKKAEPEPSPPKQLPPIEKRDFTVKELIEFNGVSNERILMAICGKVYDVTRGKSFYGPGAAYGKLAGHDATRALGTMDIENVKDVDDDTSDMTVSEMDDAKEWAERLSYKYPFVGRLIKEGEERHDYNGELAALT